MFTEDLKKQQANPKKSHPSQNNTFYYQKKTPTPKPITETKEPEPVLKETDPESLSKQIIVDENKNDKEANLDILKSGAEKLKFLKLEPDSNDLEISEDSDFFGNIGRSLEEFVHEVNLVQDRFYPSLRNEFLFIKETLEGSIKHVKVRRFFCVKVIKYYSMGSFECIFLRVRLIIWR